MALQDNPFADLIPAQPTQSPGVIYGRPKQPTQLELQREARAAEDQALQRQAADRAAMSADRAASAAERTVANDERRLARELQGDQTGLRKEFQALPGVKRFGDIRAARQQIRTVALNPNPTAQDDIALIFSYMRMLDPGSVVREGEFATAQNATGVPSAILNAYNKALSGERLNPTQRRNMAQTAENLYRTERESYNGLATQYQDLARSQGIEPTTVARRYVRDAENPAFQGQPQTTEGGDIGRQANALTISNIADFAAGLSGGRYDIAQDGTLSYNGQPVQVSDEVANSDQYRAAYQAKFGEAPPLQVTQEGGAPVNPELAVARGNGGFGETADAFVRGVADTVTLGGADELSAAVRSGLTGEQFGQALQRERGVDAYDQQNNFGARLTGQIAGGFALPAGNVSSVGNLARTGAAYGGAYGFGSANGDLGDRFTGAAIGAGAGAATAAGLGALGNALANRGAGGPPGGGGNPAGRELMQAAQRQGIDVLPADVGGPMTRRFTAAAVQAPFASGPVIRAADRMQEQASARLGQIAAGEGAAARQEALGEVGRNAAQGYIDRTGAAARRGYDQAREMAGGAVLRGERAVTNIDAQLGELAATANTDAPLINGLQRLRADLANEGQVRNLSIDAIRRLRTSTRAEAMSEGLRGTDYQRRAGQVLDALSEDIAAQLPADAAAAFRRQDAAYRERLNTIDDVMENVIGPRGDRSAEAVANRLIQMGRGDSARLRSFLSAVTPEEAGIVRGSLIQEMGRSTSGQQNAAGDAFSLQTFLSNWDRMPERTRGLLFRGESRQAIEDLARVAEGARASRAYANTSGTAGALNAGRTVSAIGQLGSTASALGSFGLSVIAENLTGRLLASQRFAQWLARAPRDPARAGQWLRRLGPLASREPAIANDILPLRQALEQSVSRAAAGQQEQDRR
jgi:hypothetical protein